MLLTLSVYVHVFVVLLCVCCIWCDRSVFIFTMRFSVAGQIGVLVGCVCSYVCLSATYLKTSLVALFDLGTLVYRIGD